jgi:hypothetical protein
MKEHRGWVTALEKLLPRRPREKAASGEPPNRPERKGMRRLGIIAWVAGLLIVIPIAVFGGSVREITYLLCGLMALRLVLVAASTPRQLTLSNVTRAKLFLVVAALFFSAGLAEIGLRIFFQKEFKAPIDVQNLLFRYDPLLGWFPIANSRGEFTSSRTIHIVHNNLGLRGPEPITNGKPTIMFLGDSFVWGYDVEEPERFTEKIQAKHPEWNVLNLGVSGYGTDQEYLLLQQQFDRYKPQMVFLIVCAANDIGDNCTNRQGAYFKPYFSSTGEKLALQGVPVPQGERVFTAEHSFFSKFYLIRLLVRVYLQIAHPPGGPKTDPTAALLEACRTYVRGRGAGFAVGVTEPAAVPTLWQFLKDAGVPSLDLTTSNRYPGNGQHWTPEGHDFVCARIEEFLIKHEYLNPRLLSQPQMDPDQNQTRWTNQ